MPRKDRLDQILEAWRCERPDLDPAPMGIFGRIFQLSKLFEQQLDEFFSHHQIKTWGYDVLGALRRSGPPYRQSPTELFSQLLLTSGAMTHRIDRLESAGLVERVSDPDDRRGVGVQLTRKGVSLVDAVVPEHVTNENRILSGLSSAERNQLVALLRKLVLSQDQASKPAMAAPKIP